MNGNFRIDRILTGFVAGMLVTPFFFWLLYFTVFSKQLKTFSFISFASKINLLAPMLSLSLLGNLALFFLLLWKDHEKAAKGVLFSTFIYGAMIVYLKYIH